MQEENKKENLNYKIISNFIENTTGISLDNLSDEEQKAIVTIAEVISIYGHSLFVKVTAKVIAKVGIPIEEKSEAGRVMGLWANNFTSKKQMPLVAIGLGKDSNLNVITSLEKRELIHVLTSVLFDLPEKSKRSHF
ncbi:MAG TPA: hypothetical protein VNX01_16390 [Bacteroidia bacterium]|jgi:hypothetical protein|nr:hypothetical protein [Bacteroidia bacterium]